MNKRWMATDTSLMFSFCLDHMGCFLVTIKSNNFNVFVFQTHLQNESVKQGVLRAFQT